MKLLVFFVWVFLLFLSSLYAKDEIVEKNTLQNKIYGMLIGAVVGDAAGGPVEFVDPPDRCKWTNTEIKINENGIQELASRFYLRDYPKEAEPYAQWEDYGSAGTITDDTRYKIIFFNMLKNNPNQLTASSMAREFFRFQYVIQKKYVPWYNKWTKEYAFSANTVLGNEEKGLPLDRVWGGIPTMAGQMPFLPAAALDPQNPEHVYKVVWNINYMDVGFAKDITSGLCAGLARALQSDGSWQNAEKAMRETDPYRFAEVPWVPRKLNIYLDLAHQLVQESDGMIVQLYELFDTRMNSVTGWEAWVPVVVAFACVEMVDYHPLAAMQVVLEYGHDTDSNAQVLGAYLGAIYGKDIFPEKMRNTVNQRMKEQFGQNIDDWMIVLKNDQGESK